MEIVLGVEAPATIIGDGTDPGSVTVAPGEVTELDAFTLATNTGLATVTEITTSLALGTFGEDPHQLIREGHPKSTVNHLAERVERVITPLHPPGATSATPPPLCSG